MVLKVDLAVYCEHELQDEKELTHLAHRINDDFLHKKK